MPSWLKGGVWGLLIGLLLAIFILQPSIFSGLVPITLMGLIWLPIMGLLIGACICSEINIILKGVIIALLFLINNLIPYGAISIIRLIMLLPTFLIIGIMVGLGLDTSPFLRSADIMPKPEIGGHIIIGLVYILIGACIGWIVRKIKEKKEVVA